jgi:hypothetical protein
MTESSELNRDLRSLGYLNELRCRSLNAPVRSWATLKGSLRLDDYENRVRLWILVIFRQEHRRQSSLDSRDTVGKCSTCYTKERWPIGRGDDDVSTLPDEAHAGP